MLEVPSRSAGMARDLRSRCRPSAEPESEPFSESQARAPTVAGFPKWAGFGPIAVGLFWAGPQRPA